MMKILVSACLLGNRVRHNASDAECNNSILQAWLLEGRVVPFCPEVAGGFPTPRPAAEIRGSGGQAVLEGTAQVIEIDGRDVTAGFLNGAMKTLEAAREHGVKLAILKEASPSCGSTIIYDGTFSNRVMIGQGVTAALLMLNGIRVFNEADIDAAANYLEEIESES
jgi:uncharacterized protein YbbK (DUF523 family)